MAGASEDIFGRRPLQFGGAFAADSACINLGLVCDGCQLVGLLTQQLSIQYQQPITRLYEVGSQLTYYVAGRAQGTANIARILGPGTLMTCFYTCLGDVCNADANDMCFCLESGCGAQEDSGDDEDNPNNGLAICLKNVVMQSLGMSVQAQDMMINEQLSLFFTAMLVQNQQCLCDPWQTVQCNVACFT